jgi:hypothetical protein
MQAPEASTDSSAGDMLMDIIPPKVSRNPGRKV